MQIYDNIFNKLYWQKVLDGSSLSLSWCQLIYCHLQLIPLASRDESELGPRPRRGFGTQAFHFNMGVSPALPIAV